MSNKVKLPKPVKGYGYVGVWSSPENTIGWLMPEFVSGKVDRKSPETNRRAKELAAGKRFFLCEIIVKPLIDKMGRPITKKIKKDK